MSSIFGKNLQVSIFGQSHGVALGVTVHGFPPGFSIDLDALYAFLQRRAPGQSPYTTQRKEEDLPLFLSGLVDNVTCGAPLTATIENKDSLSKDYDFLKDTPRPGHADYTAHVKHKGFEDIRGGGHFSGRLTAPLCVAGGIALQMLAKKNIQIEAAIIAIGGNRLDPYKEIEKAKKEGDSVGGLVGCTITGVPPGLGDPMFEGVENLLSQAIFAIPGIKGISFGAGFDAATMQGSQHNDSFYYDQQGNIQTHTNHHGGILGGITTGMPIVFQVAVKPTPSIAKTQQSVNYRTKEAVPLQITGRHDPSIVPRVLPCVEAAAALVMLDMLIGYQGYQS
ncbi:MAG: chorismate synthase [Clostridiales bacterium]|nr:chorismate synthase [Clostridiales bacterium]